MKIKATFLFLGAILLLNQSVQAETTPESLDQENFTVIIDFKNIPQKYTLSCNLTSPCEVTDNVRIRGYPQEMRIVLDLSSKSLRKKGAPNFVPTGYRYNFTIDTGKEGDFLNTAHLAKKGNIPAYEGASFELPLTYWYKKGKNGPELKRVIDRVSVRIEPK